MSPWNCRECGAVGGPRVYDDGRRMLCYGCAHKANPALTERLAAEYDKLKVYDGTAAERAASAFERPKLLTAAEPEKLKKIVGQLAGMFR
ncbi:MAG: hypothetical protein JWO31_927 [Phycisphaerales bacterium]|nr:hypothetical protein [Phycisphaerales bacterium]